MTRNEKDSRDFPDAGGLTLTKETEVRRMERMIALKGLDAALKLFRAACEYHEEDAGWAEIARAVNAYVIIYRTRQEEREASRVANMNGKDVTYMENHGTMQFSYNNH